MVGNQVSNLTASEQLAQALMLEQVRFTKQQLLATQQNAYLKDFIHQIYLQADQLQLNQVILLEQLNAVVQKYAFDLNLGPELLEFIGFVAQKTHQFSIQSNVKIHDLISDVSFENWMHKILELEQIRFYIKEQLKNNPKAKLVSLQLANQILESNTPWLDHLRKLNIKNEGISAKVLSYFQDQQQNIELKLEQQLAHAILKQLGKIITLPNEELAEIGLQVWSDIKLRSLSETVSQIKALDLEDFFILVYETWKELRQIPHMQNIILHVVEAFYQYFSEYTLQELLLSVGIDENDLYAEADRFVPFTLNALDQRGLLDAIVQSLLEPFYQSLATRHIIDECLEKQKAQ